MLCGDKSVDANQGRPISGGQSEEANQRLSVCAVPLNSEEEGKEEGCASSFCPPHPSSGSSSCPPHIYMCIYIWLYIYIYIYFFIYTYTFTQVSLNDKRDEIQVIFSKVPSHILNLYLYIYILYLSTFVLISTF